MVKFRIHVHPKTVFGGSGELPEGLGPLLGEFYLDDRLDALEAVLPGSDEAEVRTVLLGKG